MIESKERGEGEADPGEVRATASGNTNPPPPPKYKNNESVSARDDAAFKLPARGFKQSLERRVVAEEAGDQATAEIAEAIVQLARERFVLCVDERRSCLGLHAHIEAVLRRMACGEPGAVLLDGHFILTEEAHEEELALARRRRLAAMAAEVPQ